MKSSDWLAERDALQAKAAEDALQYLADTGQLFDKIEEAYAAGFESCRKMAVRVCERGDVIHASSAADHIRALQPQQKDGSDE